ncbi:acyltransferase [bacterium]|nr:acyltransferase [bacterium]
MFLSELTDKKDNNFDFLRFLSACNVLFCHSSLAFYGIGLSVACIDYIPAGLDVFFVISGFLITKSWVNEPRVINFLKKRILRIFPALIVVVLFSAFILGPLITNLPLDEYFSSEDFFKYVRNVCLYKICHILPGVFVNNPYPNVVNGSLWSLPLEFLLYLIVMVFGLLKLLNKTKTFLWILLISLIFLFHVFIGDWIDKTFLLCSGQKFFKMAMLFLMSSFLYIKRDSIEMSFNFFILAVLLWICSVNTDVFYFIQWFTLPYIIIYIAYAKIPVINHWGKYGDFSYGIYIWGFLVQQTVVFLFKDKLNFLPYNIVVFFITLFIAICSYHFVEKPMLKLKNIDICLKVKKLFNIKNFWQ